MRVIVNCASCNKEIERNQNDNNRYFCSRECYSKYRTIDRIRTTCDYCGIEIFVTKAKFEHADNHYCSKECGWNSMKIGGVEVMCSYCGKPLFLIPSKVENRENHFCNPNCYSKWLGTQKWKKINMNTLIQLYNEGMYYSDLAKEFDCSIGTIKRRLVESGVELRDDRDGGTNHFSYTGGTHKHGYIFKSIYVYPEEYHDILKPMIHNGTYHVAEHRAEMAINLNSTLVSSEIVHHKTGVKTDNRITNIQ